MMTNSGCTACSIDVRTEPGLAPEGKLIVSVAFCPLHTAAPALLAALEDALPYLERSVKFYRFQRAGREFWPNREEAEANVQHARTAIGKARGEA